MKPSIILLLAVLAQSVSGQILFSNRVTGETGYVTNVDEYFQDAKVVATNANNKFGGDGSLLTGLSTNPTNDLNTVLRALFGWLAGTNAWSGTNSFAKLVTVDNLTSTNGFTNLSLTASTVLLSDANKKTISLANGGANTLLHGTTPPAYSSVANADLANSSITVSGGGGVGISGSPVSLGGTVTVGATTDQRQMGSLGLGVTASATPGTATATNKFDVNRTGSISNVVFGQTGNTNNGIWFPNTNAVSVAINGVEVLTVSNATVRVTGTITNSGANSAGSYNTAGTATAGGGLNVGTSATAIGSVNGPSLNVINPGNGNTAYFGFAGGFLAYLPQLRLGTLASHPTFYVPGGAFALAIDSSLTVSNGLCAVSGAATAQYLTNTVYTNVSLDFPSTAAGASSDMLVTIANLKSNDFCIVNPAGSVMANGTVYSGWVSNTTCYVRLNNYNTVAAVDPAAQNFQVKVEQWK